MKTRSSKRILSLVLALIMALSLVPATAVTALAVETYTVHFDANLGTGTMSDVTVEVGSATDLPDCTMVGPAGMEFDGWALSTDGEVITESTYTPTEDNTTLYARWKTPTLSNPTEFNQSNYYSLTTTVDTFGHELAAGSYILTSDIAYVTSQYSYLKISGVVNLDLNGYSLTSSYAGAAHPGRGLICIEDGGVLNIFDSSTTTNYFIYQDTSAWTKTTAPASPDDAIALADLVTGMKAGTTTPEAGTTVVAVPGGCITGAVAAQVSTASNPPAEGIVSVQSGGTFRLYGGNIIGNMSEYGSIHSNGTVDIVSGNIIGNTPHYGGISSTTSNLEKTKYGVGVRITGGTANIYGGFIGFNTRAVETFSTYPGQTFYSGVAGGGLAVIGGTVNMYDGEIALNTGGANQSDAAKGIGAGVYMSAGTMNLMGGSICYNTAATGGGVYMQGGTFCMTGGTITHNTATASSSGGGGMALCRYQYYAGEGKSTVKLSGGSITDNTASGSCGAGIYTKLIGSDELIVGGNIQIEDNATTSSVASNVGITTGNIITVGDGTNGVPAPDGMDVHVYNRDGMYYNGGNTYALSKATVEDSADYFTSDHDGWYIAYNTTSGVLEFRYGEPHAITISSVSNGTAVASPKRAVSGDNVRIIATPDDGYMLRSITVMNGSTQVSSSYETSVSYYFTMPAADVTVTPEFDIGHEIQYHTNGGTITGLDVVTSASLYTGVFSQTDGLSTLSSASKDCYTLVGWYDNSELSGTAVTSIPANTTEDQELWAKWTEATYDITLNTNGGTVGSDNVTSYTYGSGTTLPADVTRAGCSFDGWYADSDLTDGPVTSISASDYGAKTYYAKWSVVSHTCKGGVTGGSDITFDKLFNMASGTIASGNYYLAEDLTVTGELLVAGGSTVNICLNGHVLDFANNYAYLTARQGSVVHIYDCDTTTAHYFGDSNGRWVWDDSLTGDAVKHTATGGLITRSNGYSYMIQGGSSSGDTNSGSPAVVTLDGVCVAGAYSGGVVGMMNGYKMNLTLTNCEIVGNNRSSSNGMLYVQASGCTVRLEDTYIHDNMSPGVNSVVNATITLAGNTRIVNNVNNSGTVNGFLPYDMKVTNAATLENPGSQMKIGLLAKDYGNTSAFDIVTIQDNITATTLKYFFCDDPSTTEIVQSEDDLKLVSKNLITSLNITSLPEFYLNSAVIGTFSENTANTTYIKTVVENGVAYALVRPDDGYGFATKSAAGLRRNSKTAGIPAPTSITGSNSGVTAYALTDDGVTEFASLFSGTTLKAGDLLVKWSPVNEATAHKHNGVYFNTKFTMSTPKSSSVASGNYYLGTNVDLYTTSAIHICSGAVVNICLSGYKIYNSYNESDAWFVVDSGGTLNIYDHPGGGSITNSSKYATCAAVRVADGGTFNLYGGTITGFNGSGVRNQGTFNMYGGTITGNSSGGVYNSGTMTVGGNAVISGNSNSNNLYLSTGKVVALATGDQAPTEDMTIGVTMQTSGTFVSSGAAAANLDNFVADNTAMHVELSGGALSLASGAGYTVTVADGITNGTVVSSRHTNVAAGATVTLTVTPDSGYAMKSSDLQVNSGAVEVTKVNATTYTFTMPAADVAVSTSFTPANHWHDDEEADYATAITGSENSLSSGTYYLNSDVTMSGSGAITVSGTVKLCLNGHVLNLNGRYFSLWNQTADLTICSCNTTTAHHFKDSSAVTGLWVWDETATTHTVTGGIITGGNSSYPALYIDDNESHKKTVTLTNVNFVGNNDTCNGYYYAGTVSFQSYDETSTLTMTGGSFRGNTCANGAAAMHTMKPVTLTNVTIDSNRGYYGALNLLGLGHTLTSCTVTDNTSTGSYCGCCINIQSNSASVTMTDCTITDNKTTSTASDKCGGIYFIAGSSTLTLSGDTVIRDNEGINLYLYNFALDTSGLTEGSEIGITLSDGTGAFTTGSSDNEAKKDLFFPDDDTYRVVYDATSQKLKLDTAPFRIAMTLTLLDNIDLNVYIYNTEKTQITNLEDYSVKATFRGVEETIPLANATEITDDGYKYKLKVAEAFSYQMTDDVTVEVFENEERAVIKSFSVRDYCLAAMEQFSTNAELVALCQAVLDYGASAQETFEGNFYNVYVGTVKTKVPYEINSLVANKGITTHPYLALTDADRPTTSKSTYSNQNKDTLSGFKTSMVLGNEIAVKFYFKCTEDIANYTLTYKVGDADAVACTATLEIGSTDTYTVKVDGLKPVDLDKKVTLIITKTDGGTVTKVNYSGYAFANSYWEYDKEKDDLRLISRTLVAYCQRAQAYFATL